MVDALPPYSIRFCELATPSKMDKKNINVMRRSTPDSEALASSDDDHEHMKSSTHSAPGVSFTKPARRGSWLSEVQPNQQRKFSLGGLTSPNSQPTTPSGEYGPWPTGSRAANPAANFSWNTQQWNREPPSRLTEVIQSPTTILPIEPQASPGLREQQAASSAFPFPIPLQPLRKAVRSQSYSVGQLEDEQDPSSPSSTTMFPNRMRGAPSSSLGRRSSRPSVLGETIRDSSLGLVLEDEDDTGSLAESAYAMRHPSSHGHMADTTAEHFAGEVNYRKAAHENALKQHRNSMVSQLPSGNIFPPNPLSGMRPGSSGLDHAIDEPEEFNEIRSQMAQNFGAGRGHWQSSLGFGHIEEGPQSRRHSFADAPLRRMRTTELPQSSMENIPTSHRLQDITEHMLKGPTPKEQMSDQALREALRAHEYYAFGDRLRRPEQVAYGLAPANSAPNSFAPPRASQENLYTVPNTIPIQRPARTLYIVAFKCGRADLYYIPANTGLQVKKGDMVIVEGDRGIDLGTVRHAGVGADEAKMLKEKATEEHYRWLMMFSRHAAAVRNGLVSGSPEQTPSPSSAVGGMGPPLALVPPGQIQAENAEVRPKMIKRLAQNHEVQMLRDKEGSEAKAKRVCQGKVSEHGLVMEILDAEFQLDWKKLTFFYYAESYINFNELVTDLFKIYKTRIWMSAINPASFAAPAGALQASSPHAQPYSSSPIQQADPGFRFQNPQIPEARAPLVQQPAPPPMYQTGYQGPWPSAWNNPGQFVPQPSGRGAPYGTMPPKPQSGYPGGYPEERANPPATREDANALLQGFSNFSLSSHRLS